MRIKAVGLACLVAAVPAAAIGVLPWKSAPHSDQQINEIERQPGHAVTRSGSDQNSTPEITTVVVSSRPFASAQPVLPLVVGPQLVRQMQNELKRLGCYGHDINGEWTLSTRRAMKDFLDRVNAVLPLGAAEIVHLALLKGQAEPVCGATCPVGQTLTKGDQCLPSALIPLATKHSTSPGISLGSDASTALADGSAVLQAPPVRVPRARPPSPPNFGSGFFGLFGF